MMTIKQIFAYFSYLIFATFLVIAYQQHLAPSPQSFLQTLYLGGVYGYFGLAWCMLAVLFYVLQKIIKPASYLLPLCATICLLFLIADVLVFKMYAFHLDGLLIKMLLLDFKGMGLPVFVLILAAIAIVLLLAWHIYLFRKIRQFQGMKTTWIATQSIVLLILFLCNTIISIWATAFSRSEVLVYNSYFPIYHPISSHSTAQKLSTNFPQWFPAEQGKVDELAQIGGNVRYPLHEPTCMPSAGTPNILLIGLESWQASSLNEQVMPETLALVKQKGVWYRNHIAGGTATIPGLFSLFMGVEAAYYPNFKSNPAANSSVLVNTLGKHGYHIQAITNSEFTRFNLRDLILPQQYAHYVFTNSDEETLQKLPTHLNAKQPFFDFIFLTSTHSPYVYPDRYKKFLPLPKIEGEYTINPHTDNTTHKNDYLNSVAYADGMISQIIKHYQQQGLLENTWIIITGDHAEEFNENGKGQWGHGSNFSQWQSAVPLLLIRPQDTDYREENRRSYHIDIVPTLLQDVLACQSPIQDYSNGLNLKDIPEKRNTILSSYYEDAYLIDDVVFEKNTGRVYQWRDMSEVAQNRPNPQAFQALIEQRKRFLQ